LLQKVEMSFMQAKTALLNLNHHAVVSHALANIRNETTPPALFRLAMRQVGHVLLSHATEHLPCVAVSVKTPLEETTVLVRNAEVPLLIVPILRAGLVWTDLALEWLPEASVFHLGLARNEETLEPMTYYNKFSTHSFDYSKAHVLVLDPMLATGGSAVSAIEVLKAQGVKEAHIHFICLLASPEGVEHLQGHLPQVNIITAAIDSHLNEKGYIVPGLGDAGDRTFGTL
jgi:uracil phosphoribosyltransferase